MVRARTSTDAARPLRADAQRNRDAILSAARATFEADGVLVPIDRIAVRAGVGNATLYRSFPTREDLLAAVMRSSIEDAVAGAEELAGASDPGAALAEWLVRLTWQLRIWHDLPFCVADAHADGDTSMTDATSPLLTTTGALLEAAQAAGRADASASAAELYELVLALSWAVDRFGDDAAAARRRVELATAGFFA